MSRTMVEYDRDVVNPPVYCPLCGRMLVHDWYDVDEVRRREALVCFGSQPRVLTALRYTFRIAWTGGAHYRYEFNERQWKIPHAYDTQTGKPLR